jgi:uncharacterized protein YabN with tetrapyrrole methylase and pyrophosphatase domain
MTTESFKSLEMKVLRWAEARKIIPNSTPMAQWRKAMEEMDELRMGISKENMPLVKDGVGDVVVCLINLCALADIDLTECLALAYDEIKDRKGTLGADGIFVKEA